VVTGWRYGTAHNGLHEWTLQRTSAAVLAILLPILFVLLMGVFNGSISQMELLNLLDSPVVRLLHTILMLVLLLHAYLGLEVIIEDYVHHAGLRVSLMGMLLVAAIVCGTWWLSIIWVWGG